MPDKKSSCNKSFPSLATCWGILLLIMVLRFYCEYNFKTTLWSDVCKGKVVWWFIFDCVFVIVIFALIYKKHVNIFKPLKKIQLTAVVCNLIVSTVLEKQIKNLTAETQMLKMKNEVLETQKKNLTEIMQQMSTSWSDFSVSQAQWSNISYRAGTTGGSALEDSHVVYLGFMQITVILVLLSKFWFYSFTSIFL